VVTAATAAMACASGGDQDASPDPSVEPIAAYDPLDRVDPFIATGGEGAQIANVNPGAAMPFGTTLLGPDTRLLGGAPGFYHCAGYWYNDTHIHGFSHTHAHGMGVPDYGGVSFMPVVGWDPSYTTRTGHMQPFSHDDEAARPGSYQVTLANGIGVDLVATTRGGHTRVTWPDGAEPVLLLDMTAGVPDVDIPEARVAFTPGSGRVEGYQRLSGSYSGRFGGLQTWFVAEVSPPPSGGGAWDEPGSPVEGNTSASGGASGVYLRFPEGTRSVDLRLALSYTGPDGAQRNFDAELVDPDLDARRAAAEEAWRGYLGRVRVRGGSDEQQTIFHTAMFHAMLMPRRMDDVDGQYRGLDQEVHLADHPYYSDLSLWDTFRTLHPWYILAWPEVNLDVARSLVDMGEDGGAIPRWPLGHGYTGGMVGTPATQVLAETYLKGWTDFDANRAFELLLEASDGVAPRDARDGAARYITEGFMAVEDGGGSVSETLEYAWSDHALARLGEALGRPSDEVDRVQARSGNWRNVWYADAGFFTGRCADPATRACRDDGVADAFAWPDRDDPETVWATHFVEGNAWHYLWYVPYDVAGMIDVQHGGDVGAFLDRTRAYWGEVYAEEDDLISDTFYWHGNEPVMHAAFLGSLAGHPEVTADPARWILSHRYAATPVGLDGNDDSGTLSAWYLLASTGFFPVAGTTTYAVGSPLFERVEIDTPDGGAWVVRAPGTSDAARYVTGLTLAGQDATSVVTHDALLSGEAVFEMSEVAGDWP
jgi:predicted alpha-1,2-mannosidase